MFRHTVPLGRIFGIVVDLDYSWFFIAALIAWSLAVGYFPHEYPGWSRGEYWLIGAVTAILLFVCVLLHELGHSLVAIHNKLPVSRITLFIFGGVSQITSEPLSAGVEFWMAIAGPAVSFVLALICWELKGLFAGAPPIKALLEYLAYLNFVLGLFNLIPGFPLDGGRVFRAIIWGINHNFQRATMIAGVTGRFFGYALIFLGVWQAFGGNVFGGIWIAFIGWFLESAASSQVQQQAIKGMLEGHKVSEVMNRDYVRVPPDVTLQDLVDKQVLATGRRTFIVSGDGAPTGLVTLSQIKHVSRPEWPTTTAAQIMIPREKLDWVAPDAELWTALEKMGHDGVNQLPVMQQNSMVGMLSRNDVVHYLGTLRSLAT